MSIFGPVYPPRLQAVINHTERLRDLLVIHELAPPTEEWARAWTTGRPDEMLRFAEDVVDTWRAGSLREGGAAAALEEYLWSLHEGLRRHLGCESPSCCAASGAITALPARPARRHAEPTRKGSLVHDNPTKVASVDSLVLAVAFGPSDDKR